MVSCNCTGAAPARTHALDQCDAWLALSCCAIFILPVRTVLTPRFVFCPACSVLCPCSDKVGAAISMAYVTGQPILFVGTGQTYKDLKRMNVKTLIRALMK